jgi:hypothetical protein
MKKLFLSLFVAGALTFGLQSCGEDEPCDDVVCPTGQSCVDGDCVAEVVPVTCTVCGVYDGDATGTVLIALVGTDTTFTALPVSAEITQNATGGTYNTAVDISALLDAPAGTLVPEVDGTLAGNVLTVTDETYVYQGIATILVSGVVTFNTANTGLDGTLSLTGDAVGSIDFTGVKQ